MLEAIGALQARLQFSLSEAKLKTFASEVLREWKTYGDLAQGKRVDLGCPAYKGTLEKQWDSESLQSAAGFLMEQDTHFQINDRQVGMLRTRTTMEKYRIEVEPVDDGFECRFLPQGEESKCYIEEVPPLQAANSYSSSHPLPLETGGSGFAMAPFSR